MKFLIWIFGFSPKFTFYWPHTTSVCRFHLSFFGNILQKSCDKNSCILFHCHYSDFLYFFLYVGSLPNCKYLFNNFSLHIVSKYIFNLNCGFLNMFLTDYFIRIIFRKILFEMLSYKKNHKYKLKNNFFILDFASLSI